MSKYNAIHLWGDSIFDNVSYVSHSSECVTASLQTLLNKRVPTMPPAVRNCAVDGFVTSDFVEKIKDYPKQDSSVAAVLSIGGNNALQFAHRLDESATTISHALTMLAEDMRQFQIDYDEALDALLNVYALPDVAVCTIYDTIPDIPGFVGSAERQGLALFNDIIVKSAHKRKIKIIDLRSNFTLECYSPMSPIEPSAIGSGVIASMIADTFNI